MHSQVKRWVPPDTVVAIAFPNKTVRFDRDSRYSEVSKGMRAPRWHRSLRAAGWIWTPVTESTPSSSARRHRRTDLIQLQTAFLRAYGPFNLNVMNPWKVGYTQLSGSLNGVKLNPIWNGKDPDWCHWNCCIFHDERKKEPHHWFSLPRPRFCTMVGKLMSCNTSPHYIYIYVSCEFSL